MNHMSMTDAEHILAREIVEQADAHDGHFELEITLKGRLNCETNEPLVTSLTVGASEYTPMTPELLERFAANAAGPLLGAVFGASQGPPSPPLLPEPVDE